MKVYQGVRMKTGCRVVVNYDEGEDPARELPLRRDLRDYSPEGAEWGHGGNGAAQLALAILCDALGDDVQAVALHQHFKFYVVAGWCGPSFAITVQEVFQECDAIRLSLRLDREARQKGER